MEPSAPASMEGNIKGSNPAKTEKSGRVGLTSCSTSTVWVYWAVTEYSHTVNVLREVKPGQPEFSVLAGFEDLILPSILAGGDGSICGLANVAPELFVNLVRCARNGELGEAAELHRRVLSLLALGGLGDTPLGAIKLAMNTLGVPISPTVRGPAVALGDGAREEVGAILTGSGLGVER